MKHCKLSVLETGTFALDGGAMFGVVPKVLWQNLLPLDDINRVTLHLRCLLVQVDGKNILIDTGIGSKSSEKFSHMFHIDHSQHSLRTSLAKHQLTEDDITHVILTHLHFDHAGGATKKNKSGEIVPTFKNAKYYVQKKNYDWATHPKEKDKASYLGENFLSLQAHNQLHFLEGEQELFEGIRLKCFHGHTAGQQLPLITLGQQSYFFCADLIPTSAHISLPWIMAYDNEPLKTLEEKRTLLAEAVQNKWILI
ncbi:MAG: MBL fold metallo-hydrolase, partial [Deltaproteobacteria bacterium CG_4_10_14_0_2_um_filter_43_8]